MIILIRWFISPNQTTWFVTVFCGTPGQRRWPERLPVHCRTLWPPSIQTVYDKWQNIENLDCSKISSGRDTTVTVTSTKRALPVLLLPQRSCDSFSFLSISFGTGRGNGMSRHRWRCHQWPRVKTVDNFAACPFPRSLGWSELSCHRTDDLGIPQMEEWFLMTWDSAPRRGLCWRAPRTRKMLLWTEVGAIGRQRGANSWSRVSVPGTHFTRTQVSWFASFPESLLFGPAAEPGPVAGMVGRLAEKVGRALPPYKIPLLKNTYIPSD